MRRKHLDFNYYVCDWTGLPLSHNGCYCPITKGDRQVKFGSFANWECVVAYIDFSLGPECAEVKSGMYGDSTKLQMWKDSLAKVHGLAGYLPKPAPSFKELKHFGGSLSPDEFLQKCRHRDDELKAMLIATTGEVTEVTICPDSAGEYAAKVQQLLAVDSFDTIRVQKKLKNGKGRHLLMLNYLSNDVEVNGTVGSFFKNLGVKIYGDVILLVSQDGFDCSYYTSFDMNEFKANFMPQVVAPTPGITSRPSRARRDAGLTVSEFQSMKDTMIKKMNNVSKEIPVAALELEPVVKRRRTKHHC